MDIYHGWCDLKEGVHDLDFAQAFQSYMAVLQARGLIENYRLTRRKLGLAPSHLGEFHFMIETKDLAQLERAFSEVATRAEPLEGAHFALNRLVRNVQFGLYRDFPDAVRQTGEERF